VIEFERFLARIVDGLERGALTQQEAARLWALGEIVQLQRIAVALSHVARNGARPSRRLSPRRRRRPGGGAMLWPPAAAGTKETPCTSRP